jgi:hypothetical protein
MTAWQCGGQGFESPQLHPPCRFWCQRGGHWSTCGAGSVPQRLAHAVGSVAAEGRHNVAMIGISKLMKDASADRGGDFLIRVNRLIYN